VKFFEQFPPPDREEPGPDEQPPPPSWAKPEAMLGAAVPAEFVLGRGDEAVVGLSEITAYPNGFSGRPTASPRPGPSWRPG
jgi:hypothetical protein